MVVVRVKMGESELEIEEWWVPVLWCMANNNNNNGDSSNNNNNN